MKVLRWKRMVAVMSALVMGITLITSSAITVKAGSLAETEALTLKVGEAFGLSTENIDKLLAEAGYDYASAWPSIFHGARVVLDEEYMERVSGVGVYDVNAEKTIEMLYVAEDEVQTLFEQYQNGALNEKYGTEVILVDEAEGFAYYARAEKCGSTMITIPEYLISNNETITVNIPVIIEAEIFGDIEESDWFYPYVMFAYKYNLMGGKGEMPDGTLKFDPANTITRAEFITMLYSKESKPEVEYVDTFSDVADEKWYTDAILWAAGEEIVGGKKADFFDVNGKITRQEIALVLYKYALCKEYNVEEAATADLSGFGDATNVSTWAENGMKWAVQYKVIAGKTENGKTLLSPSGNATRAEAATMLKAFMGTYEGITE